MYNCSAMLCSASWINWALSYLTAVCYSIMVTKTCHKLTESSTQLSGEKAHWRTELWVMGTGLLDSTMMSTVTAAVVLYFLLMSGDVEMNPGPGGTLLNNYC